LKTNPVVKKYENATPNRNLVIVNPRLSLSPSLSLSLLFPSDYSFHLSCPPSELPSSHLNSPCLPLRTTKLRSSFLSLSKVVIERAKPHALYFSCRPDTLGVDLLTRHHCLPSHQFCSQKLLVLALLKFPRWRCFAHRGRQNLPRYN